MKIKMATKKELDKSITWEQMRIIHCPVNGCKGMLLNSVYFHESRCSECNKYFIERTDWKEVNF